MDNFCMQKMLITFIAGLLPCCVPLIAAEGKAKVAGYEFAAPAGWKSAKPSSRMRATQFSAGDAEVVFFYFGPSGGGGVKANVDRWMKQFQDAKNQKVESKKVGDVNITYAGATGTFVPPPFGGPKTPKKGYALLGAIVEGKEGAIFIKMIGPEATVQANVEKMKGMVEGALK